MGGASRFGEGPTHYRLVEDGAETGAPCLRLLVHPAVGPVDPAAVATAFLEAIAPGRGAERIASLLWAQAGAVRVERRPPVAATSGKIHHVALPPSGARNGPRS
jgi:hypothetical protein